MEEQFQKNIQAEKGYDVKKQEQFQEQAEKGYDVKKQPKTAKNDVLTRYLVWNGVQQKQT